MRSAAPTQDQQRDRAEAPTVVACGNGENGGSGLPGSRAHPLWSGDVDRLFATALQALRREAEQAVAAVEQRRVAELTELSHAITKQHAVIEGLRQELAELREAGALKLFEAQREWKDAEAERMRAAQLAWEIERTQLREEAHRQRSVAEQLADQLTASKANEAAVERRHLDRLKEITAEVDRCLLRARAEWVSEAARLAGDADLQLPTFLVNPSST